MPDCRAGLCSKLKDEVRFGLLGDLHVSAGNVEKSGGGQGLGQRQGWGPEQQGTLGPGSGSGSGNGE